MDKKIITEEYLKRKQTQFKKELQSIERDGKKFKNMLKDLERQVREKEKRLQELEDAIKSSERRIEILCKQEEELDNSKTISNVDEDEPPIIETYPLNIEDGELKYG